MPCHARMKVLLLQGLLWLYLLACRFMVASLEPGYLDFDNLPDTNFSCVGKVIGGYYADLETNCQMFHVCTIGQLDEPMDIRFLCLNGTVFDQETRVCERIDEVDCSKSEKFYSLNLELYGNTQPPILEESPETDPPPMKQHPASTTTTTTTRRPTKPQTHRPHYFPSTTTTTQSPKVIVSHHFTVGNSADIRFNPEEINIKLNAGLAPDIRPHPISFHHQSYNNERNTRVIASTNKPHYQDHKKSSLVLEKSTIQEQTTQKPKSVVSYGLTHSPTESSYGFSYQQTEASLDYQTESPQTDYHYLDFGPSTDVFEDHRNKQFQTKYQTSYHGSKQYVPTTYRSQVVFSSTFQPSQFQQSNEKPSRFQIPLPLLPTLPPLTFSTPTPFSLTRHIESKRFTSDQQPRIIISASASVSDASGRRLNYSLGTIGARFLGQPPESYDDYKEDDVSLDPFYRDVPKIKNPRHKRDTEVKPTEVIKNEQEAVDVLKFLFDWYSTHQKTTPKITVPIKPDLITEINTELGPQKIVLSSAEVSKEIPENYFVKQHENENKNKMLPENNVSEIFDDKNESNKNFNKREEEKTEGLEYVEYEYEYEDDVNATNTETNEKENIEKAAESSTNLPGVEYEYEYPETVESEIKHADRVNQTTTGNSTVSDIHDGVNNNDASANKNSAAPPEYVDDNYEPATYQEKEIESEINKDTVHKLQVKNLIDKEIINEKEKDLEINSTATMVKEPFNESTINQEKIVESSTTEISNQQVFEEFNNHQEDVDETSTEQNLKETSNEPQEEHDNNENLSTTESIIKETTNESQTTEEIKLKFEEIEENTTADKEIQTETYHTSPFQADLEEEVMPTEDYHVFPKDMAERVPLEETPYLTIAILTTSQPYDTTTLQPSTVELPSHPTLVTDTYVESITTTVVTSLDEPLTELEKMVQDIESTTKSSLTTIIPDTSSENHPTKSEIPTTLDKSVEEMVVTEKSRTTSTTNRYQRLKTRAPWYHRQDNSKRKQDARHRFGSGDYTKSKGRGIENEIINAIKTSASTERVIKKIDATTESLMRTVEAREKIVSTDSPLSKSANPTPVLAREAILNKHTTPLSKLVRTEFRKQKLKKFIFTCFDKEMNKFYSDPRDCRLFHYCTSGYTRNQLLDMKFVCDLGTYYDDEKLLCSKLKPSRCA